MTDDIAPTLPGLELDLAGDSADASPMRVAVEHTILALKEAGLLEARHEAICALALMTADAVAKAGRGSKVYAFANVGSLLRDVLADLPTPVEAAKLDMFQELVRNLEQAGQ